MAEAYARPRLGVMFAAIGPGLVVMLADSDVGSLVTAAQSGAKWGYALLPLQIVLIPVLYVTQALAARMGIASGKGYTRLVSDIYGKAWGWISFAGLAVAGVGAIATEFSGLAGIGDLFGAPRWASLGLPAALLLALVFTGGYNKVERLSIAVGLVELVFLWLAWRTHPHLGEMAASVAHMPLGRADFRVMVAANIGAVIMPWMIFHQQSATADKGLNRTHLQGAQLDTLLGAVVSQLVMSAVLVAAATVLHGHGEGEGLQSVGDMATAFNPVLGPLLSRALIGAGIVAAAFVALNVVSLALAWSFGEVTGSRSSLRDKPSEAPVFYGVYAGAVLCGALLVQFVGNLVALNVAVEVMNALLLPLVLGLLVLLATRGVAKADRVTGPFKWAAYLTSALAIVGGLIGGLESLGVF